MKPVTTGRRRYRKGNNMKLSILDIAIIIDALAGSIPIADHGDIFTFDRKARKELLNRICEQAASAQQVIELTEQERET